MKKIVYVAEVNQWHCFEKSEQWLENADQTQLCWLVASQYNKKGIQHSETLSINCQPFKVGFNCSCQIKSQRTLNMFFCLILQTEVLHDTMPGKYNNMTLNLTYN